MKTMAWLPMGETLYKVGQKRFGRLTGDPMRRLPVQIEMAQRISAMGSTVVGKTCLEVGAGHVPLVPIGFYLSGADRIVTVDLHRRIDWGMTKHALKWIAQNPVLLEKLYGQVCPRATFQERMSALQRGWEDPWRFLPLARIDYMAPADAAALPLPAESVDIHFSVTVLEHVPEPVLRGIFTEARRVLKPTGMALHVIDPSDHFQHTDRSISAINFLQYSDDEWARIAANQFAYCNRLRASDYLKMFAEQSWNVREAKTVVNDESLAALRAGFAVDQRFQGYELEDIATTQLDVLLTR